MESPFVFDLAAGAIYALAAVASFILFVCSLAVAKRHNDPARTWLVLLRIAFPVFVVETILVAVALILNAVYTNTLYGIVDYLLSTGSFATDLTAIFISLVLAHLHFGITLARDGSLSRPAAMAQRLSYGFAALLAALALTAFAMSIHIRSPAKISSLGVREYLSFMNHIYRINLALISLFFVVALGAVVAAVWIAIKSRNSQPHVRFACRLYLASAIIWLLRRLYEVVMAALWSRPENLVSREPWTNILPAIFIAGLTVIVLALLFALGAKKARGLWTVVPPWVQAQPAYHGAGIPQPGYGDYGALPENKAMAQYHQGQYPPPPAAWQQPMQVGPGELNAASPVNELGGYQRPGELGSDPRAWEMSSSPAPQYTQLYTQPQHHESTQSGGYVK
ncbi:hypothetical protein ACRALDRAFT_1054073 [Sodiomyces alcalophilus JCM 7366]|uniref:uncharacterized protein n=1 Tax=Sodiomyces alcalophilus JCM 7366 TaxID=591952 RepID=UPI0039B4C45F